MRRGTSWVAERAATATRCVVDASVFVDIAVRSAGWEAVAEGLRDRSLQAPAHVDVEVMSAVARLVRAGSLSEAEGWAALERFLEAPVTRHLVPELMRGAWARTDRLRVADAVYVELAAALGLELLTTDARLARTEDRATLIG